MHLQRLKTFVVDSEAKTRNLDQCVVALLYDMHFEHDDAAQDITHYAVFETVLASAVSGNPGSVPVYVALMRMAIIRDCHLAGNRRLGSRDSRHRRLNHVFSFAMRSTTTVLRWYYDSLTSNLQETRCTAARSSTVTRNRLAPIGVIQVPGSCFP